MLDIAHNTAEKTRDDFALSVPRPSLAFVPHSSRDGSEGRFGVFFNKIMPFLRDEMVQKMGCFFLKVDPVVPPHPLFRGGWGRDGFAVPRKNERGTAQKMEFGMTDQMTEILEAIGEAVDKVYGRHGSIDAGELVSALIGFAGTTLDGLAVVDPENAKRLRSQAVEMLKRAGPPPEQTHGGGSA